MREIYLEEEIIVFVIYDNEKNWYICDRYLWYLDYSILNFNVTDEPFDERRKNILILNEKEASIFLDRIKNNIIKTNDLRKIWLENLKLIDKGIDVNLDNYSPSLYVNFDTKELFSMYPEPASYEDYVPFDWNSNYKDFLEIIPKKYQYWSI